MKTMACKWTAMVSMMIMSLVPMISSAKTPEYFDNTPVASFDLERFLGKWYEIARFDHKFERDLMRVTAEYSMREDGKIRVVNTGYRLGDGKMDVPVKKVSEGKAKVVNPGSGDGYLKVAFFLFFYADYRILMIDEDYNYAMVGSKKDNYLWFMSRTPEIDQKTKDMMMLEAIRRGYDPAGLIWVKQMK